MKMRLSGPPDLVRAWAAALKFAYGFSGSSQGDESRDMVTVCLEIEDLAAERIARRVEIAQGLAAETAVLAEPQRLRKHR